MKTAAIIEARMTSTRLPGKILRPILNRPTLELLIERLGRARTLDQIIVATTDNKTDDPVEDLTKRLGVGCFRGSEDDVLDRVLKAAHKYNVDTIVEITGDCPLIDPELVDVLVGIFRNKSYDYVSNVLTRTYPRGLDTQVFSTKALEEVNRLTQDPVDHEHVSYYIHEHPETFRLYNLESDLPKKFWDIRLTVDTIEDFTLINAIFEELYPANPAFSTKDILALLEEKKDFLNINRHIQQKKVR
ncbi:MAG: glycosyltransferase family protein [Methanoregula sp.]|nr:glycosyltransferase family protein [Methanoregula sp.]